MSQSCWGRVAALPLVVAGLVAPAARAEDGSAQAVEKVFQRFLDQMAVDAVVHGEATVTRTLEPGHHRDLQKQLQGQNAVLEPQQQKLVCRWAWDGTQELVESRSGSVARTDAFLRMKEGTVFFTSVNKGKRRYTIEKGSTGGMLSRPQSFYYRFGEDVWANVASTARPTDVQPTDAGRVIVTIRDDQRYKPASVVALTVAPETGALHGYKAYLGTQLMRELVVTRLHDLGRGRSFPATATMTYYQPGAEGWWAREELDCPSAALVDPQAGAAALDLIIPADSIIGDNLTGLSHVTTSDVKARDVLTHSVGNEVTPLDTSDAVARGTAIPPARRPRWLLTAALGGATAVAIVIAILSRRRGTRLGE